MKLSNKILAVVLIILIIGINGSTLFYIINSEKSTKETEGKGLFAIPSTIILHKDGKELSIDSTDAYFQHILKLNEGRAEFTDHFFENPSVEIENNENIYMEYRYDSPIRFNLPLRLEERKILTQRICFALSGTDSTCFSIDTVEGVTTVGQLNTDAELINKVIELFE